VRDRVAAARAVLATAGPLFQPIAKGAFAPVESRGVPPVEHDDWRAILTEAAERAGQMAGHFYVNKQTPGRAWADSGLEGAFPGSYARLRALADRPEELRAACGEVLADWAEALDAEAIAEADGDAAEGEVGWH
jgi:hypothetical protein